MKHSSYDLAQMQSLPLEVKIRMTKRRIEEWYDAWGGMVYVSFSGGKDSTVLKHIVDSMYDDVPSLFINTGLEYPEIQEFALSQKNVVKATPEHRFDEVIKKYGYPVISKRIANVVVNAKPGNTRWLKLKGEFVDPKSGEYSQFNSQKYEFLLQAPFKISDQCCAVMKKRPSALYEKETERRPILALMACESNDRKMAWEKTGCNAFNLKRPQSQPMAFWTEQDVLHYLVKYDVPYCSVYGDIVSDNNEIQGQECMFENNGRLKTTGCNRTGCIFCAFGAHLEKEPNRFQQLAETHPKQYKYCIEGGAVR